MQKLEIFANIASILTPLIGLSFWILQVRKFHCKKTKLENYLKEQLDINNRSNDPKKDEKYPYQMSFKHIITYVGLTKSEILKASFDNPKIRRVATEDDKRFADKILFQYKDDKSAKIKSIS